MEVWENEDQKKLASILGQAFKKCLRWPTPYFLPKDSFEVVAGGPKFDMVDYGEFDEIASEIEKHIGCRLPVDFWQFSESKSFGEVVAEILAISKKP